ncbi:prephenate dehydrogenase/arogenate dehydrogenase family protein [Leptospira ognonensis]|uniref:Prephenate dehydrogenase/arogenate dehydrogenase family protein n=1 Tax=Leptospira ognonensis TaxID=2484945 RepID=A0A4V3JQZ8_9LEPT|nr:prephenate dehydrogenase/arogenate dehydrogenase family protein [Leptospira ognonensis]TGL57973.1 prephenate dehydrogenase/arogenate dehydrogenase family protein [Leptospira ognonensis]
MNGNSKILIFGMGLMGGSLSLAIKKSFPGVTITGVVRSLKSKQEILKLELADYVYTESEFNKQLSWESFQFVIFSTPVQSVVDYISKLPQHSETVFTDLGSTKETIIAAVDTHFQGKHNYVSSHPMCGSEFSGPSAAREDLYQNKLCIVTRGKETSLEASDFVRNFWENIGSWTLEMEGVEHDETLAYLSHLPHIISTVLVQTAIKNDTVLKQVSKSEKPITGGGFRDMSRIAGSNFEMWFSIFAENQRNIYQSLIQYRDELDVMIGFFDPKRNIEREGIKLLWEKALIAKEEIQKLK